MVKLRQDSWTCENDELLAQIVLRHIRIGSTQLNAFEEAAERLQRTSLACGFRWNSDLRKRYGDDIRQAKEQRKSNKVKKGLVTSETLPDQTEIYVTLSQINNKPESESNHLDQIIQLVRSQKSVFEDMLEQIRSLHEELTQRDKELARLKQQHEKAKTHPSEFTVSEDYKVFLQILQRARQLGAIENADREKNPFKLDSSGNIEFVR